MERKILTLLVVLILLIATFCVFIIFNTNGPDNSKLVDSDNDGVPDINDDLPLDPSEQNDSDGDGFGDNIDKFPLDPAASIDTDDDGYPNRWNPGKNQSDSTSIPPLEIDEFPDDPNAHKDSDGDGIPSNYDINDNVNLSIMITLEKFEVTGRVDFFRWAQVYFDITIDGKEPLRIDNNGKNWIVKLNEKQNVEYTLSYDIPDLTDERYMDIEVVMYDHDLIFEDDIIDIGEGNEETLLLKFDKVENAISSNNLAEGNQGKLWYVVTVSEEFDIPEPVYERLYSWRFNEKYWKFSLKVPVDIYSSYAESNVNRMPQSIGNYAMVDFVTSDDRIVKDVASTLKSFAEGENYSKVDTINFILRFVQKNVIYASDNSTKGQVEYWKYPVETLVDKKGDCEDSSVLFASIMDALGYDVAMLFYVLEDDIGHLAVGIHVDGIDGEYIENKDGKKYYYCETTNSIYVLGEIPPDMSDTPDRVIVV